MKKVILVVLVASLGLLTYIAFKPQTPAVYPDQQTIKNYDESEGIASSSSFDSTKWQRVSLGRYEDTLYPSDWKYEIQVDTNFSASCPNPQDQKRCQQPSEWNALKPDEKLIPPYSTVYEDAIFLMAIPLDGINECGDFLTTNKKIIKKYCPDYPQSSIMYTFSTNQKILQVFDEMVQQVINLQEN